MSLGPREDRVLITGLHTVCDIHCNVCGSVLGWKYEVAFDESQKYKEGKFIIEKTKVLKVRYQEKLSTHFTARTSADCVASQLRAAELTWLSPVPFAPAGGILVALLAEGRKDNSTPLPTLLLLFVALSKPTVVQQPYYAL